jgi:hypothetical protein
MYYIRIAYLHIPGGVHMGRKKLSESGTRILTIRIPQSDAELLERLAKVAPGGGSPASVIRQLIDSSRPQIMQMLLAFEAYQSGHRESAIGSLRALAQANAAQMVGLDSSVALLQEAEKDRQAKELEGQLSLLGQEEAS